MGDVTNGLDQEARRQHLGRMHVDKIAACRGLLGTLFYVVAVATRKFSRRWPTGVRLYRGWVEFLYFWPMPNSPLSLTMQFARS